MKCSHCRQGISRSDARKAEVLRDDKGHVVGMLHYKCKVILNKRARMGGKRWRRESPTAYAEVLRKNRDDLSPQEQARVQQAEARYAELRERVRQGVASGDEKVELGDLAVARDGEQLDVEALELEGVEEKARRAQEAVAQEREKEAAPHRWDDYRGPSSVDI